MIQAYSQSYLILYFVLQNFYVRAKQIGVNYHS